MTSRFSRFTAFSMALVAILVAGIYMVLPPAAEPDAPGVSFARAHERAARVSDVTYDLHLTIPSRRLDPIDGSLTVEFTLSDARDSLVFDFAQPKEHLATVEVNGQPMPPTIDNGHIVVPAQHLIEGRNRVAFQFRAGDDALNRGDDMLYSLFVPARASHTFPCFDQPDLKARWRLSLRIPSDWVAVSNGRELSRDVTTDAISYHFEETPPISTYLFAFAAGRFQVERMQHDGRAFRVFHRETDEHRLRRNLRDVVEQHARALTWMEDYTSIPYRFPPFDMILLPAFQFSGMEHPGAVYYNADALLLDETATQHQHLARANLIAHETAHMWFGNLVTMPWFDDVWLKEVFANVMAAKMVNPTFADVDHDLRFLVQHYPTAYTVDRTDGANPIRQSLANLSDAGSLYGAIIYQKAPIVIRQLEMLVGAPALQAGLRDYLSTHEFGNASWLDLVRALERHTPHDISSWSRAWIEEPGRPTLRTDLQTADGVITRLVVRQSDTRGRDITWPQRVQVLLGSGSGFTAVDATLAGSETAVDTAVGLAAPTWVLPIGGGLVYGDIDLDDAAIRRLITPVSDIDNAVTRAAAVIARWEAMLDGQIPPASVFDVLLEELPDETNELVLQLLLDQAQTVFWRFTPGSSRQAVADRLELTLRTGLENASTNSEKAAWFGAIRRVAVRLDTLVWLEDVWARRTPIEGFVLSEADETSLAIDLAIRRHDRADAILTEQLSRIDNLDRRARLQFIAPALSPNPAEREAFFQSLHDVRNRAHEAWVLDAVRYLHHPLRADDSQRLLTPALTMLRDIRRTGDIFFATRWAEATLSGYRSRQAADEVRRFVERLPRDYPTRLRWVLLTAADPLFRSAALSEP